MTVVAENISQVFEKIAAATERSGRNINDIKVVAISKTYSAEHIIEAIENGILHIGENKIQEAEKKFGLLDISAAGLKFQRHFVGHLQTNKAAKAVELFDLIHSVDSFKLAEALSRKAESASKIQDILIQVNTSAEESKFGIEPEQTADLTAQAAELPGIRIKGLMTIGAFLPEAEMVRPFFVKLRKLSEEVTGLRIHGVEMKYLSMGMTNDFEAAVEEGANLVRIGTAIFGARKY